MSTRQKQELDRYPKFKALYLLAFEKMLEKMDDANLITSWNCAEDVMRWWTQEDDQQDVTAITAMLNDADE